MTEVYQIARRLALLGLVWTAALNAALGESASPTLSVNALFLAGYTKKEVPHGAATGRTGLFAQQVEATAAAAVDSQTVATVTVVLPGDQGARVSQAFLRRGLGQTLVLKAGRFYADLGLHNLLHPQAYPFLDPPLVLERLFGTDGVDEVGLELAWTLPTPWRATGSLAIVNGDNRLWVNPTDEDLLYLARVRNRWRASRRTEVQVGGSWAGGRNARERLTYVAATDLRVSRLAGPAAREPAWIWQSEYLYARENLKTEKRRRGGLYTLLEYRSAGRWLARARYDHWGWPGVAAEGGEQRVSLLLGFEGNPRLPLRFQYSRWQVDRDGRGYNQYHLQLNFTLQGS